jgi:hypothetical protein
MIEKIQQAEQAIRAGDTRTGFDILRQVLAEDPNSERAWWIMSSLVPREQRGHCLNEVLRINPNNQMARETLQKLRPGPPERQEPAKKDHPARTARSSPVPESETPQTSQTSPAGTRTWFSKQGSRLYLTVLAQEGAIRALSDPKLLPKLQAAVSEGRLPEALIKEKTAIPYRNILRVRQLLSSLRVFYQAQKREESLRLELEDKTTADEVLKVLGEKLGPEYILSSTPLKTGSALGISAILTLGAAGITAFLYWGALEVASGRAAPTGSAFTRTIINLLDLLGPGGVIAIGAVLIIIALAISAWVLFKPPTVTELARR